MNKAVSFRIVALISALGSLIHLTCASAFLPSRKTISIGQGTALHVSSRRSLLLEGAVVFASGAILIVPSQAAHAVAQEEANDFIQALQARSVANRDQYLKESTRADKLSTQQFKGQYKKPKYVGVRKSDGSFDMLTPTEIEALEKSGEIKMEYGIGKNRDGSEYVDYSKRIMVFVESP